MITYLLPILIGYTGGKLVYDTRGGVVGAAATMGMIVGAEIPMFLGGMIMGPLGGYLVIGIAANADEHVGVLANLAEVIEDPDAAEQLARTTDPLLIVERLGREREEVA
jgi:hypothetical protein